MPEKAPAPSHLLPEAPDSPGVLLGEGSQYAVYDTGDGRVRKVPLSREHALGEIGKWHKGTAQEIAEYATLLDELGQQANQYVSDLITAVPRAAGFFGNPRFESDGSITQDKVTPLEEALRSSDETQSRHLIEEYVGTIKLSWKYGCYDWVFNLGRNNAVDAGGNVIMMDFGEMGYDNVTMHRLINQKAWAGSYDAQNLLNPAERQHLLQVADEELTHEALDERWKSLLPNGSLTPSGARSA